MNPPRCLIVTQDPFLRGLIHVLLDHGEYDRRHASDAREASAAVGEWHPQLVVLDIDIDEGAGVELVDEWKRRVEKLPIIGVTRRDTIAARLGAYERGIDDLLVVPFPPEELVARALGIMRRVHGQGVRFIPEISVGALRIDLLRHRLRADDRELELTRIEKAILYVLAANADRVMSRDELLTYVWGVDREMGSNIIDRHIAQLRAKLGDEHRHPRFIETVAGEGYRFKGAGRTPGEAP
ncbi:MAG: response regulator transcription factor [Candidatus Limnocylindria bacterium]